MTVIDRHDERFTAVTTTATVIFITVVASTVTTTVTPQVRLESVWPAVYPHNSLLKDLHIPKLAVPTGLSSDGRPTGVQLWGRAVPYDEMFDDDASTRYSVAFLQLAARAVEAIHAEERLRRVAPPLFP